MQNKNHSPKPDATTAITKFVFHGDELDVIPMGVEVYVAIRRVCEALGVSFSRQLRKLKTDPAISVVTMATQVENDDQRRDVACLELHSLPLWLATIHPSKVKPAVREKLVAYRRECAEVLADHFLGKRSAATSDPVPPQFFAWIINRLGDQDRLLTEMLGAIKLLHDLSLDTAKQVRLLFARDGVIRGEDVDRLKAMVVTILDIKTLVAGADLGDRRIRAAIRGDVYGDLFGYLNWGRKGQPLAAMPADKYPLAWAFLDFQIRKLRSSKARRSVVLVGDRPEQVNLFTTKGEPKPN